MAYQRRELPEAAREEMRAHLALCPECARTVLDLGRLSDIEPVDPGDRLSPQELQARWQRMQRRLETEAPPLQPASVSPTPAAPPAASWASSWLAGPGPAWAVAAVLLLVLGADRLLGPMRGGDDGRPRLNVSVVELVPNGWSQERGEGSEQVVEIPADAESALLVLNYVAADTHTTYAVTVWAGSGPERSLAWQSDELQRTPEGVFRIAFPADFLADGRYAIEIFGDAIGETRLLATYELRIRHTKDR